MVTTRKRIDIPAIEATLQKFGVKNREKVIKELSLLPRSREKAPPPPTGGICLRRAAKKYGISQPTLTRLVQRGEIPVLARTPNWLYVDENALSG